jgi:protein involved in polysaccharide export with SLBB domain
MIDAEGRWGRSRGRNRWAGAAGLTLAVALTALSANAAPLAAQDTVPPARDPVSPAGSVTDPADVLRPGDIVRLRVWREEDFSGDFPVDRAGRVVLPRLGALDVTGVSTAALYDRIITGLSRYLRNPSIDVVFLKRITIHGAVTNAGLYPVDPTMTVLDALAMAGGAGPEGRLDRIQLIRDGDVIATVPTTGVRLDELRIRSGDQLFVPEQTWLRRNTGLVATIVSTAASVAVALLYMSRG